MTADPTETDIGTSANREGRPSNVGFGAVMNRGRWIEVARIVVVGVFVLVYARHWAPLGALWATVAVGLYPLAKTGVIDLTHEHKVGTEIFVTFATIFAVIGGEAIAGAVLMTIILFAEFIADLNTERARASIKGLIGSVPKTARLRDADGERVLDIEAIRPGDVILVRAGEQLPVDGLVVGGNGAVDEASITGEPTPKDKAQDSTVFAGTILRAGALDVCTERAGNDTTFARIVSLVEDAEAAQAPIQRLADTVAAWLIPVVVVFLAIVFIATRDVRKVVTLMIFTSPAELGLATPMVMIAAIARAARSGILVKGGLHLEALAQVDTIVFDKTGTLTIGQPEVDMITVFDPAYTDVDIATFAAAADRRSAHPLAKAVVDHAAAAGIDVPEPTAFETLDGQGVAATVSGRLIVVGNERLLSDNNIATPAHEPDATVAWVAIDGTVAAAIHFADQIRPGARDTITQLRRTGIRRVAMLTGDNAAAAHKIATELGIDEVFADLLPEHKVDAIHTMQREGHRVAMVGDGINDAPALATADVGIAMAVGGTQAALEAADIALLTNDLSRIVFARAVARRAYRTIKENLFVGVGVVHVLGITAALLGLIGPVQAAIIHLGPDLLVFLNSTKLLRVRIDTGAPTSDPSTPGISPRATVRRPLG
jgi:heavy metal translocating P-type ATPase